MTKLEILDTIVFQVQFVERALRLIIIIPIFWSKKKRFLKQVNQKKKCWFPLSCSHWQELCAIKHLIYFCSVVLWSASNYYCTFLFLICLKHSIISLFLVLKWLFLILVCLFFQVSKDLCFAYTFWNCLHLVQMFTSNDTATII